MIVRNYHINKDRVSDIWDDYEYLQQSGEYVLADMLSEPSNHDDTVHFKNDPLGPPNISSENHSECDIVSDSKKKRSGEKKSKSKFTLALPAPSIETQPIPASKKDTNNMDALYEKMVEKSTKIVDEKRSVILKITRLFPKKTFAKLIDFRIKFESNGKLLLKLFHANCHILITHFFFNVSSSLKSCKILSGVEEVLHSGKTFAQF